MKSILPIAALCFLLFPAAALAQPPGCTWEGDPAIVYGWGYFSGLPYHQPGPDSAGAVPGQILTYRLGPLNASPSWLPAGCKGPDTLCFHITDTQGWTIVCTPAADTPTILGSGYLWYQDVSITIPCGTAIGQVDRIIAQCVYANSAGVCDPSCGDCHDPNVRPANGLSYYSADTLYVTVGMPAAAFSILQDSSYYVMQGQTQAHIPFSICNENECAPPTPYGYRITSVGRIGSAIDTTGSVTLTGGDCEEFFAVINAGTAPVCTYDTLTIIAWGLDVPTAYDTCVQVVHSVSDCCVPLLTAPVTAILAMALLGAAAAMLLRRSRAAGRAR